VSQDALSADLERRMGAARPSLVRLARARGLSPESAEDAVQETLLEAWRHLDACYAPETFSGWLMGICRNVCRRYTHASLRLDHRQTRQGDRPSEAEDGEFEGAPWEIADPLALDPTAALERQDIEILLDRALGYLPPAAREAVELCYLAELPQHEAARRLGFTIRALEARLRRARAQLRQVLAGELRAEAEAFGLTLDGESPAGWRETRLWCPGCGRRRLRGVFEPLTAGQINLHLRCPGCGHEVNSYGHIPLDGMRAFRPAYKRVMRYGSAFVLPGLASGRLACLACGAPQPLRILAADALGEQTEHRSGLLVVVRCEACARHHAELRVVDALWPHSALQQFIGQHPRYIAEPETLVEYQGQPAIRVRLSAAASSARLTMIAHPQTVRLLATFEE
jgi:RNA polymerase sigma-70 factor (ECF subfamily)